MPFVCSIRVRFVDTDTSGRIHHTAMLRFFEAAEQEFFRSLGLRYQERSSGAFGLPRVHVECDFTGPTVYDDLLDIAVSVERIGASSVTLGFDAAVQGRHVARGNFVIVCLDLATGRSRPLPEEFAAALRGAG